MSYDVSNWETKELCNLRIPIDSFFKHEREDWHPDRTINDDGSVTFSIMESYVRGTIEGNVIDVSSISAYSEGSGTALNYVFEPALEDSTGKLVATRVWEGGDYIDKLTVIDGDVKTEKVTL